MFKLSGIGLGVSFWRMVLIIGVEFPLSDDYIIGYRVGKCPSGPPYGREWRARAACAYANKIH